MTPRLRLSCSVSAARVAAQVGLLAWGGTAIAQPGVAPPPGPPLAGQAAYDQLVAPGNLGLGAVAGVTKERGLAIQPILDASVDEKTGSFVLGWKDGQGSVQLAVSGPLDKRSKTATPLSLLGLSSGASLKLSASRLNWRGPNMKEQADAVQLCADAKKLGHATCSVRALPEPFSSRLARYEHLYDRPWYIGAETSLTRNTFDYRDALLTPQTATKVGWTAGARAGLFSGELGFLIGSAIWQHDVRPGGAETDICEPISGTTATRCDAAVLAAPKETDRAVVSVELRHFFRSGLNIVPSVQRDLKGKVTSVDVPFYFLRNSERAPIGGVRAGWRSDTKAVTVQMFVSAAVGLTP